MFRSLRRVVVWSCQHGFTILAVFLVVGYGTTFLKPRPAQADEEVDILKEVALSDVGLGERLMALEGLKDLGSSAALDALKAIAEKGSLPVAAGACAQLGRVNSSSSKSKLKTLLEDSNLNVKVRMAAASCIAEHWKDSGDLSYLESKCASDDDLKAHCAVIKGKVFKN